MMDFNEELIVSIKSILGDELVVEFIHKANLAIKAETYKFRKIADKWMDQFEEFCIEHELDINISDLF